MRLYERRPGQDRDELALLEVRKQEIAGDALEALKKTRNNQLTGVIVPRLERALGFPAPELLIQREPKLPDGLYFAFGFVPNPAYLSDNAEAEFLPTILVGKQIYMRQGSLSPEHIAQQVRADDVGETLAELADALPSATRRAASSVNSAPEVADEATKLRTQLQMAFVQAGLYLRIKDLLEIGDQDISFDERKKTLVDILLHREAVSFASSFSEINAEARRMLGIENQESQDVDPAIAAFGEVGLHEVLDYVEENRGQFRRNSWANELLALHTAAKFNVEKFDADTINSLLRTIRDFISTRARLVATVAQSGGVANLFINPESAVRLFVDPMSQHS